MAPSSPVSLRRRWFRIRMDVLWSCDETFCWRPAVFDAFFGCAVLDSDSDGGAGDIRDQRKGLNRDRAPDGSRNRKGATDFTGSPNRELRKFTRAGHDGSTVLKYPDQLQGARKTFARRVRPPVFRVSWAVETETQDLRPESENLEHRNYVSGGTLANSALLRYAGFFLNIRLGFSNLISLGKSRVRSLSEGLNEIESRLSHSQSAPNWNTDFGAEPLNRLRVVSGIRGR